MVKKQKIEKPLNQIQNIDIYAKIFILIFIKPQGLSDRRGAGGKTSERLSN